MDGVRQEGGLQLVPVAHLPHILTDPVEDNDGRIDGVAAMTLPEDMSIEEIDAQIVPMIEDITGDGNVQTTKVAADTKHQRDREALDRTAAHQVQYDRGNKGRDITVDHEGGRLE